MDYQLPDVDELLVLSVDTIAKGLQADAVVLLKSLLARDATNTYAIYLLAAQHAQLGMAIAAARAETAAFRVWRLTAMTSSRTPTWGCWSHRPERQHGVAGAIDRYDPGRGIAFQAYAMARVRGSVFNGLRAILRGQASERYQERLDTLQDQEAFGSHAQVLKASRSGICD